MVKTQFNRSFLFFIEEMPIKSGKGYSRKNTWGGGGGGRRGEDGRRYIFLWVVGAESFQIIWVIGVRLNQLVFRCVEGEKRILSAKKRKKF